MTRIYRYVLMGDGGMAPNPRRGLITLATCKPEIRRTAQEGDWVIGNYPAHNNDIVAWAGKVKRSLPIHQYAINYPTRHDALHELGPNGELRRIPGKLEWYHPNAEQQRKDRKGNVLVFDKSCSWYFGARGRELPESLKHLAAHGQGHRVNGWQQGDLELLESWLCEQAPAGIHGEPRHGWDGPDEGTSKLCGAPKRRSPKKRPRC